MLSLTSSKLLVLATFAFAALNGASARSLDVFSRSKSGINCDGSGFCAGHSGALNEILQEANEISQGQIIQAGVRFACKEIGKTRASICAFADRNYVVQHSDNGQANSLGDIIKDLIDHGCNPCGTAPMKRTGNDLSQGAITVNYIQKTD